MKKLFCVAVLLLVSPVWADFQPPEPAPAKAGLKRYVVSDLGAVGDGQTVNTPAIQAAIDQCAAAGGGVLVISKGTFVSGALYFKQGVNLMVEKEGVLKSTASRADFPPVYTRWEGIERYWTPAFLNFIGVKNVEVSGGGWIDASGLQWMQGNPRIIPGLAPPDDMNKINAELRALLSADPAAKTILEKYPNLTLVTNIPGGRGGQGAGAQGPLPRPEDVYPSPLPTTGTINIWKGLPSALPIINAAGVRVPGNPGGLAPPRTMVFQNCDNVRVSGVNILNEARWGFVFIYCNNVLAENLAAINPLHNIPSSDGMDIDSCKNVHVIGCYFECNDDCLSIKAGKDEDGRRVNRPCEDVLIENTHFAFGHGGAAMGSETSGGIRNVTVRNCLADQGNLAPIRFKTQVTRGGIVENITYENITLNDTRQAVEFNLEWSSAGGVGERVPPIVRNVKIINVNGLVNSVGSMHGLPDSPIDNVTFVNCHITSYTGLVIDNVTNLHADGLRIDSEDGQTIVQRGNGNFAPLEASQAAQP